MTRIIKSSLSFEHITINFKGATDSDLIDVANNLSLGLSLDELRVIKEHYVSIKRDASDVELQTYDQTWSEHCFHKTFKSIIETPEKTVDNILKTYIMKIVEELNPKWCFSVFEDNAGIVDFDDEYAIAIKVETHNHPSAIEPFGGAATGLGGVIRDVLGVWANPIACTDVLCFGPLDYPYKKIPDGIKHPTYLFRGVVDGIGSYGNSIGIPTVNGAVYFDENYLGNIVVYAGCIGLLRKKCYIRNVVAGDLIVLLGGRTGLDGIHGVTFASTELKEDSEETSRPAVQIANPIEEEKIKRAINRISHESLGSGITDLGGGGLSCAVCEMANYYGIGAIVYLEKVHLKYPDMVPWEIWISESQERMCIAVSPNDLERVLQILDDEQVEANIIGQFTKGNFVKIYFKGNMVAELDINTLFDPPRIRRHTAWKPPIMKEPSFRVPKNLGIILKNLLAAPNIASKEIVIRRYDHEVKGSTVIKPLQGWNSGPSDGAVLKPQKNSWRGISISCGMNPRFGKIDPYWMAASAIDEAVRNNIALGGRRIALLDNFTWGNPEYEDRLGGLILASKACYDVAKIYGTPFISGKDSLYNESPLGPVSPTLLITALGIVPDIRKAVTMDLKENGNVIYIVGYTKAELGGSEYYKMKGFLGASIPKLDPKETIKSYKRMVEAVDENLLRACHDLSEGGLGVAAAEMAFTGDLGLKLDTSCIPGSFDLRDDFVLFSESNGRLLVEVTKENSKRFEEKMKGTPISMIGVVTDEGSLVVNRKNKALIDLPLVELINSWKTPLGGSK